MYTLAPLARSICQNIVVQCLSDGYSPNTVMSNCANYYTFAIIFIDLSLYNNLSDSLLGLVALQNAVIGEETGLTARRIIGADREPTTSRFPSIHLDPNISPLFGDCAARYAALFNCTGSAAAVDPCSPTDPVAMAVQSWCDQPALGSGTPTLNSTPNTSQNHPIANNWSLCSDSLLTPSLPPLARHLLPHPPNRRFLTRPSRSPQSKVPPAST